MPNRPLTNFILTRCLLEMWTYRSAWDPVHFFAESILRLEKHQIPLVMSEEEQKEWRIY